MKIAMGPYGDELLRALGLPPGINVVVTAELGCSGFTIQYERFCPCV